MRRTVVTCVALAGVLMGSVVAATAATTTGFAQWGAIAGTTTDYTTTMQLPAVGFPQATLTTDSRADVAIPTGATNWFGEKTPPGLVYGSSRDQAYINLRPRADNAASPSTSTYTFDGATPQGWAFVLGDIDADQVRVSATRADGTPATTAELGFRSAFNLCGTTPKPSSVCADNGRPKDIPTWDPATATLTGNAAAVDSDGATGWFEPAVSLRTLTFTFTRRSGFPVFQTWFAVKKQDVAGTVGVTTGTCDLDSAEVSLIDAGGEVVRTAPVIGGAYAFTGVAASNGFRVALSGLPASCISDGPSSQAIDLRSGDATAPFKVRQVIPVPIIGQVTDASGPLEGVTVTLTPNRPGVPSKVTTTDASGRYVFDDNADDTIYTISVTQPTGYLTAPPRTATIPDGATAPIINQNFVLQALPTVSGTISGPDGPLAGVTVELTGGGQTYRAVTAADGTYDLPFVPAGGYSLQVPSPPAGYQQPAPRPVTVGTNDIPDQNIQLARVPATGSVAGTVTLDGAPAPGIVVAITPTGGAATTATTGPDGTFGVGGLAPGTYDISVTKPGSTNGGPSRAVTITVAGEDLTAQDFVLTTDPVIAPVTPVPTPTDPTDPAEPGDDGTAPGDDQGTEPAGDAVLPDSGGPSRMFPLLGLALMVSGAVAVVGARPRRS